MAKKIIIIGAGPAGYPCALKAAKLGAEVTLIENNFLGGVCLNSGCIPSKSLLDGAHKFATIKELENFSINPLLGEEYFTSLSFLKLQERRENVILKLRAGILKMLEGAKVNYVQGEAKFISDKQISVNDKTLDFDSAVIATGTRASLPKSFEKFRDKIYDNSTIFNLKEVPPSLTILGGGVIACEFACMMQALGSKVTIVEMLPEILPTLDESLSRSLKTILTKRGVTIYTGAVAKEIKISDNSKTVVLESGKEIVSNEILVALGRRPNIEGLNLKCLGIETLNVNPATLEIKPNIYAVGDVNGLCLLAHAATEQGLVVADRIMGQDKIYDNTLIPSAIYTWPEVASVGLSVQEAVSKGFEVLVRKSFFLANGRAIAQDEGEGFVQIIEEDKTAKILGAQIIAPCAGELIHIPLIAMKAGLSTAALKNTVFAHPTFAETIKEATYKSGLKK